MTSLKHNSFTKDSQKQRLERLRIIEEQYQQSIVLMPGIHEEVALWMRTCYSEYNAMVHNNSKSSSESSSLTVLRKQHHATLRSALLLAKEQIHSGYAHDEVRKRSFALKGKLPTNKDALMRLGKEVLRLSELHKEEGITHHISDALSQRLDSAIAQMQTALELSTESASAKKSSFGEEQSRFESDTRMLKRLLGDWHADVGYNDASILSIGMVNSKKGGNSGQPGSPELILEPEQSLLRLLPNSKRPAPTSYALEYRLLNSTAAPTTNMSDENWQEFYTGNASQLPYPLLPLRSGARYQLRARARNANGYGNWSAVVEVEV